MFADSAPIRSSPLLSEAPDDWEQGPGDLDPRVPRVSSRDGLGDPPRFGDGLVECYKLDKDGHGGDGFYDVF